MKGGCAMQSLFSFDSRRASYIGNRNMVHFLHFLHLIVSSHARVGRPKEKTRGPHGPRDPQPVIMGVVGAT